MLNAWVDLKKELHEDECVEAVVFGPWGWGSVPAEGKAWELAYGEPDPPPVPFEQRGKVLSREDAEPLMANWSFFGGYGAPTCYAVRIWTNKRVLWVTQYDGATCLDSSPRHPVAMMPSMPGG